MVSIKAFAVINRPLVTVYETPEKTYRSKDGLLLSSVSDEGLYGAVCRVLGAEGDMVHILSYYGYPGYVAADGLLFMTAEEAGAWLESGLMVVNAPALDVMNVPKVQGVPLLTLPRGALLAVIPEEERNDGWTRVRLADGREGYVTGVHLSGKRFDEPYLDADADALLESLKQVAANRKTAAGGRTGFSLQTVLEKYFGGSEEAFRTSLTETARSYLGVQYRWGGRSCSGIDCSGLVGMSYMLSGVCIYRDASIVDGYAMRRLPTVSDADGHFALSNLESMKPGDALYFPGHIAMYLGDGEYIHSTGKAGDNGVVLNSLIPGRPRFRQDLLDILYAVGGVRTE